MPATILDGRTLATALRGRAAERAAALRGRGFIPRLDAVLVGAGDTAARQYAESQARTCRELGIEYVLHEIAVERGPAGRLVRGGFDDIAGRVLLLNTKDTVAAVMVHLPLPDEVEAYSIQKLIDPDKDVEGVNPANIGNVVYGRSSLAPCTALAVIEMVDHTGVELQGKMAVVVGASDHVGKPIAVLLMRRNATVVSCNKWTPGLADLSRKADVLVAAAGVPGLIKPEMVKPGAVVIDVGVNRVSDPAAGVGRHRTVGDVDFEGVSAVASWISPVPGGVGPVTVATLLTNVVDACERAAGR
ncbi:MAG: bifunctional 5,10-methylenetetrahydrofolate dehydrogenase/5,10-methenyltetrahydrofolate cyclohydrolase [Phycisphaeraceae bacterium]|nr:bifunctional 5,10-methylenetetrahydrofolate dehydrogenase/5,10-methenyltetrahydrofolate cyclohydrolase [Phycisphaeraceae bacterium]